MTTKTMGNEMNPLKTDLHCFEQNLLWNHSVKLNRPLTLSIAQLRTKVNSGSKNKKESVTHKAASIPFLTKYIKYGNK